MEGLPETQAKLPQDKEQGTKQLPIGHIALDDLDAAIIKYNR